MKSNHGTTRRDFLRWTAGLAGLGWLDHLTLHAAELRRQQRACILLWMAGGPSQFETLDPKAGADNQGPTKAIPTTVPSLQIAEHWTRLATVINDFDVIRSMTSKEGNH